MDLDAWLKSALEAQDKGLPLPTNYDNDVTQSRSQKHGEESDIPDEEHKQGNDARAKTSESGWRRGRGRGRGRVMNRREGRGGRSRGNYCPYNEYPLGDFKQILSKPCSPSLNPTEAFHVLSDDESVDGMMDDEESVDIDSKHHLVALYEDDMVTLERLDTPLKNGSSNLQRTDGRKVRGKRVKERKDEDAIANKHNAMTEKKRQRWMEYEESLRLSRRREMVPMGRVVRRPQVKIGEEGIKCEYEYRFLDFKVNLEDDFSDPPKTVKLQDTVREEGSKMEGEMENKEERDKEEEEEEEEEDCTEDEDTPPKDTQEGPNERETNSINGKEKVRRHYLDTTTTTTSTSPSIPSQTTKDKTHDPEDVVPIWNASEQYPMIVDPENTTREEEQLDSDVESALEKFKCDYEKYKDKDRVGAPFWEELRRSVPSFGFDRAREETCLVGYDEDGKEVPYTDERLLERLIRESQVLEYQAKCKELMEKREMEEEKQQGQRVGKTALDKTDNRQVEDVSYVGEEKSVWWRDGFSGMDVELKHLELQNDQVVCVVGKRMQRKGRKGRKERGIRRDVVNGGEGKVNTQSEVHNEVIEVAKKLRKKWHKDKERNKLLSLPNDGGDAEAKDDEFKGFEDDVAADDNFEEDLKVWNEDNPMNGVEEEFECDYETKETSSPAEKTDGEDDNDEDSPAAFLRTVPMVESARKTTIQSKNSDWGLQQRRKREAKAKMEEERCRGVMFSHSLQFQEEEKERRVKEKRTRMLDSLRSVDRELHLLLEDLGDSDSREEQ